MASASPMRVATISVTQLNRDVSVGSTVFAKAEFKFMFWDGLKASMSPDEAWLPQALRQSRGFQHKCSQVSFVSDIRETSDTVNK